MYASAPHCPRCDDARPVLYWGTNESGTRRFRCKDCDQTFTAEPKSNRISPEKEALIQRLLEERLSVAAIARATHSAKRTVYNVLKKTGVPAPPRKPRTTRTTRATRATRAKHP